MLLGGNFYVGMLKEGGQLQGTVEATHGSNFQDVFTWRPPHIQTITSSCVGIPWAQKTISRYDDDLAMLASALSEKHILVWL